MSVQNSCIFCNRNFSTPKSAASGIFDASLRERTFMDVNFINFEYLQVSSGEFRSRAC